MNIPDGYKQTEVGVIPEDWKPRTVGSVCNLINGRGFKPFEWEKIGLPIIRIQNLNGSDEFNYYRGTYDKKIEVDTGQLLFAWSGSRGTSFGPYIWNGSLGLLNYHTWKVQIQDHEIDKEFLFHALKQLTTFIEGKAHGASALVHTQKWEMEGFEFPLPPTKAEQEAIAKALSDADGLIESLEQLIAKKRYIKQGAMQELLTGKRRLPGFSGEWEEKTFGEIFDYHSTATNSRSDLSTEGDTYYVHYGDIHTKYHSHLDFRRDQPPKIDRRRCKNATLLQNGDWVMADASEDFDGVGKSIEISGLNDGMAAVAGLHTFLLREKVQTFEPGFKGHLGNLKSLHEQFLRVATGMKVYGVSKAALKDLVLSVPSPKEQTAIASILSDMDAEIAALETKLAKTRQLKQGMMHNLLTGRIRLVDAKPSASEITADKERDAKPAQKHNWAFNEAVVIAVLADRFGKPEFPLGRKRCTKLTYLLHRRVEQEAQGYLKKAAGPYNPQTRYGGPEAIARKNGYIKQHKHGKFSGFIAAEQVSRAQEYFSKWYSEEILTWLEQFRFKSNEELECLTTVDMAMQDLLKQGQEPSLRLVRELIASEPEWLPKLDRTAFSAANIAAAIAASRKLFEHNASGSG